MLREKVVQSNFGKDFGFRWRGKDVSRVEGFSDNVFGFALTLLVVSLEVPKTFSDLEETFRGFFAFALAFLLLFSIWYYHYKFFRRYGIEDTYIVWLNALLLFVMLFFVYPLKFLFTYLVKMFMGISNTVLLSDGSLVSPIQPYEWKVLMIAYGLGFIIIYGVLALMNIHALSKKVELDLNGIEIFLTKSSIAAHLGNCFVGTLSVLIITIFGYQYASISGITYICIGPVQGMIGYYYGKQIDKLKLKTVSDQ